jgi:ankyrin repeat protein
MRRRRRCNGLDVDRRDQFGDTPLTAAARVGHLDVARKLLDAGARTDNCSQVFGTPLMAATRNGHHHIMHELIERGAPLDAANATGQTALWYARIGEDEEAVRILTAAGAVAAGRDAAP